MTEYTPYVLWDEPLPHGGTAKVIVCPGAAMTGVVLHLNGTLHGIELVETCELAEQRGWVLLAQMRSGEIPARDGGGPVR